MGAVEPMRLYQLLWLLFRHGLRGRWRYEVQSFVAWSPGQEGHCVGGIAGGPVESLSWVDGDDRFVVLEAHCDARPDHSISR